MKTMMRTALSVAVAFLVVVATNGEMDIPTKHRASNLPGGYSDIPDLTDPRVQVAASFAVQALVSDTSTLKRPHFSFSDQLGDNGLHIAVVQGFRQVVAGMNYDLVLVLTNPSSSEQKSDEFVGSFRVTIYDRFGDLSITKWGQEYTKEETQAMGEFRTDVIDSEWKG